LAEVFGVAKAGVTVLNRSPNVYASTFPSELVDCRIQDEPRRLFLKYGQTALPHVGSHRSGVGYEWTVYRDVLAPIDVGTAEAYGGYFDASSGSTWLMLEALEFHRVSRTTDPLKSMVRAAGWIADFHRINESRVPSLQDRLIRYDCEYFAQWARRTRQFTANMHPTFAWLPDLCRRFADQAGTLLNDSCTVIHGEFYPANVLAIADRICPIDWESAAIGAGEIDLASLTEGWPASVARACEQQYQQARRSSHTRSAFEARLSAAKLYFHFRWLGNGPGLAAERIASRLPAMKELGERLSLI